MNFKEIINKVKALDKKILFGALIAVVCVIVLALVLILGGKDETGDTKPAESGTQKESQTESDADKESQTGETEPEGTGITEPETKPETEPATEPESQKPMDEPTDEPGTEPSQSGNENPGDGNQENGNQGAGSSEPDSQKPSQEPEKPNTEPAQKPDNGSVNDEPTDKTPSNGIIPADKTGLFGEGTQAAPYDVLPKFDAGSADEADAARNYAMTLTTVAIEPGKSVHYSISRIGSGNIICKVSDKNAYIVCGDKKYTPKKGVISFMVPEGVDRVNMEIGNTATESLAFELKFNFEEGCYDNPEKITDVKSRVTKLAAGDADGYFYEYTTTQAGVLRFYMSEASGKKADIYVTVVDNGIPVQRFFSADAADGYLDIKAAMGKDLQAGMTVLIQVVAVPERLGEAPEAVAVTWYAEYK